MEARPYNKGSEVYLRDAPDGEVLDQDLKVSSNRDNLAHVLQDNLHNAYQGSDAGRAFSLLCRKYERW